MGSPSKPPLVREVSKMELMGLKEKANKMKSRLFEGVEGHLSEVIDEFVTELQVSQNSFFVSENDSLGGGFPRKRRLSRKERGDGSLPEKTFIKRNSLLTELLEIEHIRSLYHIFISMLVIHFLSAIAHDLNTTGTINLKLGSIPELFGSFWAVVLIEVCLLTSAFTVYPVMSYWAHHRSIKNHGWWDKAWLAAYVIHLLAMMYYPVKQVFAMDLPLCSTLVVVLEQTRIIMKIHAFVRSNITRVMKYKYHQDDKTDEGLFPDFSKYLYFMFIPTIVYRDTYPRTQSIDWHFVFSNFAQVVGCIIYMFFLFTRMILPVYQNFGKEPTSLSALFQDWLTVTVASLSVLLVGFFLLLHSWMNAFAEMLCFGDRMFYKDWWNCKNYSSYYRTWNVVVHDWLYEYIYRDAHAFIPAPNNKLIAKLLVFFISSIVHEYVLCVGLKYFYPILLFMFGGLGMSLAFFDGKSRNWNIFMWLSLFLGMGLLMSLYAMESFARINCPQVLGDFWDFVTPRSWTCNDILFK